MSNIYDIDLNDIIDDNNTDVMSLNKVDYAPSSGRISGGKLYDQGSYGCIFMPTLKCKDDKQVLPKNTQITDGTTIDKLIIASQAEDEFNISKSIHEIPLWKNYFIVSDTICEPAPLSQQVEKDLSKCKPIQGANLSSFRILRMTFGGTPLSLFRANVKNFPVMDMFKHLLEAVSLMTLFGIVHRDLHQGNILVDKSNVARIIDFNLSINARKPVTSNDIRHSFVIDTFQEPPDSCLVNAISLGFRGQYIIDNLINGSFILRNIQSVLGISLDEMKEDLEEFYRQSVSAQTGNDEKWFKTYWRTIDSWSIGANFVIMILRLSMWKEFVPVWKEINPIITPILKKLCEVNPMKRYDAVQALNMLDPQNYIIRKYAKSWLNKVGTK